MVREDLFELFTQDNVDKQAKIEYSGGVMTNTELFQNSEELTESLCSEKELRFGCCEASCFKFKVYGIVKDMYGETVKYSMVVGGKTDSPMMIGQYKVSSDTLTADRQSRQIVSYDAMYDILNADMTEWYNGLLPDKDSKVTMRQFRQSFIRHFGLDEFVPEGALVNDDMTVEKTIEPEQISGKDIITAICEINGCFGHIGRDGKFHYIYLPQAIGGLYPSDDLFPDHAPDYLPNQQLTGHLYPQDPKTIKIGSGLRTAPPEYESYATHPITKLQIRQEENDIGHIWPDGEAQESDNCYIIQDNFLVYGKSHEELGIIAQNIFGKITNIVYKPFNAKCTGNPCFEVGDPISINTKYDIVESYIFKRVLKGVQALRDTYSANGNLKYGEKVNGLQNSIKQLKSKANILTRTVEETRLQMINLEKNAESNFTATAEKIAAEVKRAQEAEAELQTELGEKIEGATTEFSSKLEQTAEKLSSEITERTEYIDTSPYTVDRKGNKLPSTVYVGEYFLDETTLKIYYGEAAVPEHQDFSWSDIAVYDFNKNQAEINGIYRYEISPAYESAVKEYGVPNQIYEEQLDDYDYGTGLPPSEGVLGQVYLEITWRNVIDYWLCGANYVPAIPAYWREMGTAKRMDFPEISSKADQTAKGLETTVKNGEISSKISQEAGQIDIGADRIAITSKYFRLSHDGKMSCQEATVTSEGSNGKTVVENGGFYIKKTINKTDKVAAQFYGGDKNNSGAVFEIFKSPGDSEVTFSASSGGPVIVQGGGLEVKTGGLIANEITVKGNFSASGTKNRIVNTQKYGNVLQYCYEMSSPVFGDLGTGRTDIDGLCYIYLDPLFTETVNTTVEYSAFLQKEGEGDLWVAEKHMDYFLVQGTPNLSFSWEVKAKQAGFEYERLENFDSLKKAEFENYESLLNNTRAEDYEGMWGLYLDEYNKSIEEMEGMAL